MNKPFLFKVLTIFFFTAVCGCVYAFDIAGGHTGGITALIHRGDTVISAGEDGCIVIWDIEKTAAAARFQLTPYRIQSAVSHPLKNEICIVEAADFDNYRISVWNYTLRKKMFSVHSVEPVTFVNYSANGSFIIAAGFNGSQITILDSETGKTAKTPDIPAGTVSFAATGRSERNIFIYQPEFDSASFTFSEQGGQILYLDLDTGFVISHFRSPAILSNPVIFNNNSFLAGINSNGLLLIDAASGAVFDTIENIDRNALLCSTDNELYCLNRTDSRIYRFSVDGSGKLAVLQEFPLSSGANNAGSFAFNKNIVLAQENGNLLLLGTQNRIVPFTVNNNQTRIKEIAATGGSIAVLTENSDLFILPADYTSFSDNQNIQSVNKNGYTRIIALPSSQPQSEDLFLLWQTANTRSAPQLIKRDQITNAETVSSLTGRFPLRSVSSMNGKILVLDSGGNLSIRDTENIAGRADFNFSSAGAVDAVFIDSEYLVLCRSAINNNSPFILLNYRTGETVQFFYPAQTGLSVYSGSSGNIYAEMAEQDRNGIRTTVVDLSSAVKRNGSPVKIFESPGETPYLSMAESEGQLAISADDGAFLFSGGEVYFERTNGLPVKLLGCEGFFLSLDSEGNIAWHDNKSGKILAVFSLYGDQWKLSGGKSFSGRLSQEF